MKRCISIVDKLNYRSVTAQKLGVQFTHTFKCSAPFVLEHYMCNFLQKLHKKCVHFKRTVENNFASK